MYQIGLFATGRGQGSRQLIEAIHAGIESGHLPAKVAFVFSNRQPGEFEATDGFFDLVRRLGYPLEMLSFRKFRSDLGDDPDWRTKYDREVRRILAPYSPDLCVLAGYLLIFSEEMCRYYTTINLHPAAPGGPVGMWQQVIWQLIEGRARQSGNIMLHVTPELDKGPIVAYSTFPIAGPGFDEHWAAVEGRSIEEIKEAEGEDLPLFKAIREHGAARERPLVVATLEAFAEGRLAIRNGLVVDGQGCEIQGVDLTQRIEASVVTA